MRELHSFSDERVAYRLVNVLKSRHLPAHVEPEGHSWVIWIENDDDRDKARTVLTEFQSNPDSPEFSEAEKAARQLEIVAQKAAKVRQSLQVDIRDRWRGVWWRCYPATMIMIAISALVVAAATDWSAPNQFFGLIPATCNDEHSAIRNALFIQKPVFFLPTPNGDVAIFEAPAIMKTIASGQVWRFVTPIFLHFSFLHILFNMMWLRDLGTSIEFVRGTRRFLILVVLIAVASNTAQLLWVGHYGVPFLAPRFGGMSGVVFGLIGYIWMKGRTQPHLGLAMSPDQLVYSILWMLLCIGGGFGAVANTVHVVGFATGMVIGARQAIWKRLFAMLGNKKGDLP